MSNVHSTKVDEDIFSDFKIAAQLIGYAGRAIKRHRRVGIRVFFITMVVMLGMLPLLPRYYKIASRVLTQQSLILPALVNPTRAVSQNADEPTRSARELVMSHANLEIIIKEIKLAELWRAHRSLVGKVADFVRERIRPMSQDDLRDALIKTIEKRVVIKLDADVVIIEVEWSDARTAYVLSKALVDTFLKIRRDADLNQVRETVLILQRNTETVAAEVETSAQHFEELVKQKEEDFKAQYGIAKKIEEKPRYIEVTRRIADSDAQIKRWQTELQFKKSEYNNARIHYEAALKQTQEELIRVRGNLAPNHPDVLELTQRLATLQQPPAQVLALKEQVQNLEKQLGGQVLAHNPDGETIRMHVSEEFYKAMLNDPKIVPAMTEYQNKEKDYNDLKSRLTNAKMELETATAAMSYRYMITRPPVFPKEPTKPKLSLLILGSLALAGILGCAVAFLSEMLSGRIEETWQAKRFLGVAVLGEMDA
jgi:uncharacterized protein involved in exopolysaccharide biosynthesis